jgi:CheY-like chemotaxis protein
MDLLMPEMDGYQATKHIRALNNNKYQQLPIIALSAAALAEVRDRVYSVGMNAYLTKPFNPNELYLTIVKCINKTVSVSETLAKSEIRSDDAVNFDNILEITGDNPDFLKEFMDVALESMEELIGNYERYLQTFDLNGIRETKHKHTPLMEMLNLHQLKKGFDDSKALILKGNRDQVQIDLLIARFKHYGNKVMNEMKERKEEIEVKN